MLRLSRLFARVDPVVFTASALVVISFLILGSLFTEGTARAFDAIHGFILTYMGWLYILVVSFFLLFVVALLLSRYGSIRLGDDDSRPEFSFFSWMAMLFSCGMGIGLVFWSIAEPISHFATPPVGEGGTVAAAEQARRITMFHWGLHAWGIYIIVALSLAYFSYRRKLPLTIRSAFYPILGERVHGPIGHTIDTLAIFGTLFGIATSLGLGVLQINTGLNQLAGVEVSTGNQIWLIAIITGIATISVVTGIKRGVRWISEVNLWLSIAIVLFIVIAGPTLFIVLSFVESIGDFAHNFITMSFQTYSLTGVDWQHDWTMFYWAWWIAWSPFVGTFIARVSKGRTIREFIIGVLLVPSLLTFFWLNVFGGTALNIELFGAGGIVEAVADDYTLALYATLDTLPLTAMVATLATVLIATYFITSSDSGTYVINALISRGDPDPPTAQRVIWGLTEGGVAAVLLLTGGLTALQTGTVIAALPFAMLMVVMCFSLYQGLRTDQSREHVLIAPDTPITPLTLAQHTIQAVIGIVTRASKDIGHAYWQVAYDAVRTTATTELSVKEATQQALEAAEYVARDTGLPEEEARLEAAQGAIAAAESMGDEALVEVWSVLGPELLDRIEHLHEVDQNASKTSGAASDS